MQPQDVTRVLNDPLAQELMQSSIPARLAYVGPDGFPRAIPIGFHWDGVQFVLCTVPDAPKVSALKTNPKVALTVDTNAFPPHVLLVRGTAAIDIVDGVPPGIPRGIQKGCRSRTVGLSDAISNSDREVAPPGELRNGTLRPRRRSRRLEREELPGLRQIARVSTFCEPVVHVMEHFALVG
jgi:Pyridoxamine 5'-phosphate oxidase